jgi:quinol monooxygenase YgiN
VIRLSGKLICKSLEESELIRRFLPEHIRLTKNEPGCVAFEVKETADPLVWTVEELFVDQKSFEAHQGRTKKSSWGVETGAIKRQYEIQEVS